MSPAYNFTGIPYNLCLADTYGQMTDVWTYMMKLIGDYCDYSNAPKNWKVNFIVYKSITIF